LVWLSYVQLTLRIIDADLSNPWNTEQFHAEVESSQESISLPAIQHLPSRLLHSQIDMGDSVPIRRGLMAVTGDHCCASEYLGSVCVSYAL
jgi:hypothetical protein